MPPIIPPSISPMTPTTPFRNPMSPISSPNPPFAMSLIRNSLPILPNWASGKRNSNRNSSAGIIPGLLK